MRKLRSPADAVGALPRRAACAVLVDVLERRRPLDQAFEHVAGNLLNDASESDRAMARALATTTVRYLGQIDDALGRFLSDPIPKRAGPARQILRLAAAELLFLGTKPHAAVNVAVSLAGKDRNARHFRSLINAVLRRLSEQCAPILEEQDAARLNTPSWLWERWRASYGEITTRAIAAAHLCAPPLDFTLHPDGRPDEWAERLEAEILPTGSLRRLRGGRIQDMHGFEQGVWWIQDAAAALPVKLFGPVSTATVLDLCAAPGGKTAQLAAAGAKVVAVDRSAKRLDLVRNGLKRLNLHADLVAADAAEWDSGHRFSHILLDAPCTATGTLRRHPDVAYLKSPDDIAKMARVQRRMLDHAATLLRNDGVLVYCTCSLEREEGPDVVDEFLERNRGFVRRAITPDEVGGCKEFVTHRGDLHTIPGHWADKGGLDGFFAARLVRSGS